MKDSRQGANARLVVKLNDGREVELAEGVTRDQLDLMLTTEDVLDMDGRHYLVSWDDVADVFALT